MFPIVWIVSMSINPLDVLKPTTLSIIPKNATLSAYVKVLTRPYEAYPVSFGRLLMNSLIVAGGTALFSIALAATAAYAFQDLNFQEEGQGLWHSW